MADQKLENCLQQPGSYFVAVEAGADRTSLQSLLKGAEEQGYAVLKATFEKEGPYLFEEALPEKYAEKLRVTPPAKLLRAFVVSSSGLEVSKADAEYLPLESDIFAAMHNAVTSFMQDTIEQSKMEKSTTESYQRIQQDNFNIEGISKNFTVAVIYEGDVDLRIKGDLEKTFEAVNEAYGKQLEEWDGSYDSVSGIEEILREKLFDLQKYTGNYDVAALRDLQEQRKWKLLKIIDTLAKDKKTLIYIDGLDIADSRTLQDVQLVARNAKNFVFMGVYTVDSIKDEIENRELQELVSELKREGLCEVATLCSDKSVYEILPKVSENAKKILQLAAIGTAGSALLEASGLKTADFSSAYLELQNCGLLLEDKVATQKLKERVAREIENPEIYTQAARAIENVHKDDVKDFAGTLFELYSEAGDKEKALEWARTAAETSLGKADLINALRWYRTLARIATDAKEKLDSLERVIEIGFYQDFKAIEQDVNELEKLALEENDIKRRAVAKLMKGKVCVSGERLDKALKELEQADEMFRKLGKYELCVDALNSKGVALNKQHKAGEALECFEKILKVTENKSLHLRAYGNIGHTYRLKGESVRHKKPEETKKYFKQAVEYFKKALNLADDISDMYSKTKVLDSLAGVYGLLGHLGEFEYYEKAKECLEEGVNLCRDTNNLKVLASLMTTQGYIDIQSGEIDKGIETSNEALEIAKRAGDEMLCSAIHESLAEAHLVKAKEHAEKIRNEAELRMVVEKSRDVTKSLEEL